MSVNVGKFRVQWVDLHAHMRAWNQDNQMVLNTVTNKRSPLLSDEDYAYLMEYFNANRKNYVFN